MTKRPPTPTGWSDTDWIKKLQYDEENPLACLHINQGSFDAAADAYEEEYKMSKRIAAAVAAEREECAMVCIAQADRLEGPSDACGIALVCAGLIRARTKP